MKSSDKKVIKKRGVFKRLTRVMKRYRLGDMLLLKGFITVEQLQDALVLQKTTDKQLGQIFIEKNLITPGQLRFLLVRQFALRSIVTMLLFGASINMFGAKKVRAQDVQVIPVSATYEFSKVNHYPALLGTVEKRDRDLRAFTKWTGMFARFERELENSANKKMVATWQTKIDSFKGQSMKKMADGVNRLMNEQRYILDKNNWGKSDYWATPVEFMKRGGDCEDFAIAKYAALRSLGVPEERMRLAIVQDTLKNIPHAVLVVYTDEGTYLLDNQNQDLVDGESKGRYKPIFSINRQAWWLHTSPTKTLVASVE